MLGWQGQRNASYQLMQWSGAVFRSASLLSLQPICWVPSQSRIARIGQLIGFARATSDGSLSATIWDVAITPAWQVRWLPVKANTVSPCSLNAAVHHGCFGFVVTFLQRSGLGRALIERLTAKLVRDGSPTLTLVGLVVLTDVQ